MLVEVGAMVNAQSGSNMYVQQREDGWINPHYLLPLSFFKISLFPPLIERKIGVYFHLFSHYLHCFRGCFGGVILNRIEYFRIRVANTCFKNMIGIARRIHNYLCITNSDYWKRGANPLLSLA